MFFQLPMKRKILSPELAAAVNNNNDMAAEVNRPQKRQRLSRRQHRGGVENKQKWNFQAKCEVNDAWKKLYNI